MTAMSGDRTTVVVQRFLDELAELRGDSPAQPLIRALLSRTMERRHLLCRTLLFRSYLRLTRPPLNLQSEELLSAAVKRPLKAMREVHPQTVRQFFTFANRQERNASDHFVRRKNSNSNCFSACLLDP